MLYLSAQQKPWRMNPSLCKERYAIDGTAGVGSVDQQRFGYMFAWSGLLYMNQRKKQIDPSSAIDHHTSNYGCEVMESALFSGFWVLFSVKC